MQISIKGARVEAHMTQRAVAKEMGVTKETIGNWENGKTSPTATQLVRLCEIYSVKLSEIFLPQKLA